MCDIYMNWYNENFQPYTFQRLERSSRNYRYSLHDSQILNTLYIDFKQNIITYEHLIDVLKITDLKRQGSNGSGDTSR